MNSTYTESRFSARVQGSRRVASPGSHEKSGELRTDRSVGNDPDAKFECGVDVGGGGSENGEHNEEKEFSGVMHPRDPVEGR